MEDKAKERRLQIWTLVVGAVMAIITGILSASLSDYFGQRSWTMNIDFQQRSAVLQKRLDLIERTAKVIGKAPGMDDLWQRYLKEIGRTRVGGISVPDPDLSTKLGEYNGEFKATLELDALFFGPKTRVAIVGLKGTKGLLPYWEYPSEKLDQLLSTMGSELQVWPVGR